MLEKVQKCNEMKEKVFQILNDRNERTREVFDTRTLLIIQIEKDDVSVVRKRFQK